MSESALSHDTYQFKQRIRSFLKFQEAYEVTDPETKEPYFYAKRDRLWFKKDAHVFEGDSDKGPKIVTMKDESIFDAFGSFAAVDNDGNVLARFRRKFWRSFFWRETWEVEDGNGNHIGRLESKGGVLKTLLRKGYFLTYIPVIGSFLALFMRLHFQFKNADDEIYAEFSRKFSLRDFYKLEFLDESKMNIDKRAAIGIGVLLDAAENR